MQPPARALLALCLAALPAARPAAQQPAAQPGTQPATQAVKQQDCRTCHTGAVKSLRASLHAALDARPDACVTCHTNAAAHARSAADAMAKPVPAGPVQAAACAACHEGRDLAPALAAHAFRRQPPAPAAQVDPSSPDRPLARVPAPTAGSTFDWDAVLTFGYRFRDVHGSRDRFETDIDLDEGFRLAEVAFDGEFTGGNPWLDTVSLSARSIDDPYAHVRGRFERKGVYRADAGFRRDRMKYRAGGDFHRVDRRAQTASYDLAVPVGDGVEVFAGFARTEQEGFWVTSRIGNRNLVPIAPVDSVSSPRRLSENQSELGLRADLGRTSVTFAFDHLDQHENKGWTYARPAGANPAFPESEDSRAANALEGPGARFNVTHRQGALELTLDGRALDRRRRTVFSGVAQGYDTAEFTTTTRSLANGAARTWLLDLGSTYDLTDHLALHTGLRYLDHSEHLFVDQNDFTVYPTLSTSLSVDTVRDQRTSSRLREATAELEWQAREGLWLRGGWGWSQEKLSLPDLEGGDSDFSRGTVTERGFLAGAHWRPTARWSLRADYRDFGQGGLRLHEIVDRQTRMTRGAVRFTEGPTYAELSVTDRQSQNGVADSRSASTAYTLTGGLQVDADLRGHLSYTLADIDTRTRTNFYFNPSTTPVPTLVGFHGETQTAAAGADWQITKPLLCRLQAAYTTTHGDFEIDLYHWSADLAYEVDERVQTGLRVDQFDYHEAGNPDDYSAWFAFLYVTARIGNRTKR